MSERISYLDGWRGLAIAGVLFAHFFVDTGINLGRFGVELFFVLSGRLMADILFSRDAGILKFYGRRVTRIYPALLVFVVITAIASQVMPFRPVSLRDVLAALTFTYNYYTVYVTTHPLFGHLWSLCIEEHMYLLLGAVAFVTRRLGIRPEIVLAVLAIGFIAWGAALTYVFGGDYYAVYWRSDVRGASILLGAIAFLVIQRGWRLPSYAAPLCFAAAVAFSHDMVPDVAKYSAGSAFLAISLANLPNASVAIRKVLAAPWLVALGAISYSLYLWQQPAYQMLSGPFSIVPLMLLAIVLAVASTRLVERPARRFLNASLHLEESGSRAGRADLRRESP